MKAGILAVLAVVAACYWANLAWSWAGDGKTAAAKSSSRTAKSMETNEIATGLAAPINSIDTAENQSGRPQDDWQQIAKWIENDPRTAAVDVLPGRTDAFETDEEIEEVEKEEKKAEPEVQQVKATPTPQELGMELSSTLVVANGGFALIDGKSYRIGNSVTSAEDGHQTSFRLTEIHTRHVVLEHDNSNYKLFLPEKEFSGNISITIKK